MNLPEYLRTNDSALAQRIVENGGCPLWPDLDGFAEYLDAHDLYSTSEDPEFEKAMQLYDAWVEALHGERREIDLKLITVLRGAFPNNRVVFTVNTANGISRLAWVVENDPLVYTVEEFEGDDHWALEKLSKRLNGRMGLSEDDVLVVLVSSSIASAERVVH